MIEHQIHARLTELADDVGRLRRRVPEDSSLEYAAARIAAHVEALLGIVEPTAAELAGWYAPGDDAAIVEAIRLVDARSRRNRLRLGQPRQQRPARSCS